MAGDWIKMRAAIMQAPEVISMARVLQENRTFRDWLTPGAGGPMNGQVVSDDALRCVVTAAVLRVWSAAREHGKFDGDDLVLPFISIADLDLMAAIPGIGEAMEGVEWAIDEECQIRLPKFKKYNVPPESGAERQARYRQAQKDRDATSVTPRDDKVTSRVTQRRVEKKNTLSSLRSDRAPASRRVPADFVLSDDLRSFAAERGFSQAIIDEELAKFRDCSFPKPHSDWPAAWRNWVRRIGSPAIGQHGATLPAGNQSIAAVHAVAADLGGKP